MSKQVKITVLKRLLIDDVIDKYARNKMLCIYVLRYGELLPPSTDV